VHAFDPQNEAGMAVIAALLATVLLGALGSALVLNTSTETMIAANFRNATEARYAVESIAERVLAELLSAQSWDGWLNGSITSTFVDGPPSGSRTLVDGSTLDLQRIRNVANCGKPTACTVADMNAVMAGRAWGANNPRWQLSAHGNLHDIHISGVVESGFYVIAMVGDDAAENDGDPTRDGATPSNPGSGILRLRAEAFGPRGAHKVLEATIARPRAANYTSAGGWLGIRVLGWLHL
jgi:hypothetical protein